MIHFDFIQVAYAAEAAEHEVITAAAEKTTTVEHVAAPEQAPEGIAGKLGLDVTYFIGQLITFSILLFVLWKWVFTPVAKKLTERAENIEKAIHDAERITKEKLAFESWKNEQMVNARHEASVIIGGAQTEANKIKDQTLVITKNDQEKIIAQARAQIEQEKNQALASAKGELANLVTFATEKIIKQKMDSHKDQEMVKELLKTL